MYNYIGDTTMKDEEKFEKKLTEEEIEIEINKIGDFFKQIPEESKAITAEKFIYEIVNWGCRDHYQALGIFQEAMNRYREVSLQVLEEEAKEEEEVRNASENAQNYRCLREMDWMEVSAAIGEVCKIGYAGENEQYAGGKKYIIFREDGRWTSLCQRRLDDYFELVENTD